MPYYSAGDYYRGDVYGRNYAAGGLFSFVGKAIKKVGGAILSATPLGQAFNAAKAILRPAPQISTSMVPYISGPGAPPTVTTGLPEPGITGAAHRLFPGGSSGYGYYNKRGEFVEGRRPRMNVTNVRALKRAGRRVRGFLKIASRLGALPVSRSGKGKLFKKKRR